QSFAEIAFGNRGKNDARQYQVVDLPATDRIVRDGVRGSYRDDALPVADDLGHRRHKGHAVGGHVVAIFRLLADEIQREFLQRRIADGDGVTGIEGLLDLRDLRLDADMMPVAVYPWHRPARRAAQDRVGAVAATDRVADTGVVGADADRDGVLHLVALACL